jgi:hypothetical protein
MSPLTRLGALVACGALALPARHDVQGLEEDPRPVFVPLTRNPFSGTDLDVLNANLLKSHSCWRASSAEPTPTPT